MIVKPLGCGLAEAMHRQPVRQLLASELRQQEFLDHAGLQVGMEQPAVGAWLRAGGCAQGQIAAFAEGVELVIDELRQVGAGLGHDTQVFEFIALEHTRKNKMILAVKRRSPSPVAAAGARSQIDELKPYFGIREQALETLLRADAVA